MTLILNNEEVRNAIHVEECLQSMEEAYRELATSRAVNRPTSHIYAAHRLARASYSFKSVEGAVEKFGVLALRITSDIAKEEKVNGGIRLEKLPLAGNGQYVGLVQLFSIETGELLAIMPDGLIQQFRVGITSALAAKALCRQDAAVLGLIGSGGQARAHLRLLASVRPINRVKVFSTTVDHRKTFAAEMEKTLGLPVQSVDSVEEAVEDSDLVCTATNSSRPIITGSMLGRGVHLNAIREFEVNESVFEKTDVIAIHTRYGGIHHYLPPGLKEDLPGIRREKARDWNRYPELGDLLTGRAPQRTNQSQITFFLNNIGTGIQFAVMGYCVYRRAIENHLGKEVPTDWFLQDIKP
ncbi:MAG: ornithine cyclodeaminase family protein [Candidatus Binatia bacterium]